MGREKSVCWVLVLYCLTLSFLLNGVTSNLRPNCDQTFYSTTLEEGPGDGHVVFTVSCHDTDSGPEGELTYTLSDGAKGQFRVDSDTGSVIMEGDSDAEKLFGGTGQLANPYTVSIIVADKGTPPYSTPVTVFVDITSVNDNTPTMVDLPASVQVSETEAVGKVLSSCSLVDDDVDTSDHGTAYIRIKSGNEDGKFVLNQINCDLMLISPLDYETTPSYTLTLEAYDLDPVNPLSSTKDLLIEVVDINDFTPACVGYNILREVSESAPIATTLTTLDCFDKDGGLNGQLEFKVSKGDPKLTVNKITGDVSLIEALDFEAGDDLLEMEVIVYDLGTPSLSASVTVLFKVKDADDNPPQWTEESFNATITENTLVGSIVISLSATDLDTPNSDLSKITYGLEELCDPDWFLVDAQIGSVVVKNALDWETSSHVTCLIHAYSSDQFNNRTFTNVSIALTDINDRAPIFDKFLFTGSVREDAPVGTSVIQVDADDPDDGINGKFVLSMPIDSPFSIDPNTGEVTLSRLLDYETMTNYLLTVVAKDKGTPTQSSLTYVNIQVDPVNEFDPTISAGISLSISEDAEPGTALTKMSADDQDAGLDGEVEFFLLDSNVPFLLESVTGDLRIGIGLDRETKDDYSLDILVMDKSNTSVRSSQSTIRITITDVNDNAPVCDLIPDVQVFPPISNIDPVTQLSCSDPDVGNTLSYFLVGGDVHGMFSVNSQNGKITLTGAPVVGFYTIYVEVQDNGTPNLKVTVPIPITVESQFKFDNLPKSLLVWENTTVFTHLFTVNTSGTWDFVSTEIVGGNDAKLFNLNPSSGQIRLVNLLDWETTKSHVLKIRSISSNGQLIENELIVDVIDINDDDPTFDDTFFHIKTVETLPVPALLKIITANDYDDGISSEIEYSVFSGNDEGIFNFTENGEFQLLKVLDYEKWTSYSVTIEASDRGDPSLSSTAVVFVEVVNLDDNPLLFDFLDSTGHFDLSEDIAVGTLVVVVNGSDADTGSDIQYSIATGNELGYFTIDKYNGTIYTATTLDYETVHGLSLGIQAENSMGVTSTLSLEVVLLDINDNTPTFSKPFYSTEIPHATPANRAIGQVTVTDRDSEENGRVTLTIETGNDKNHFLISGSDLVTTVELDSDVQDFYTLVIQAIDGGVPARSSSTIFQIIVDEKLLTPKFPTGVAGMILVEDRAPGTVFDCDATMLGSTEGEQGDLTYTIVDGNEDNCFFIDRFTCKIDLVKTLDFSSVTEYSLQILATHREKSNLNDTFVVNFDVHQLNKHTPIFTQEIYAWSTPEDTTTGTPIGSVTASDKDVGDFGRIEYVIESSSKFGINSTSGLITTVAGFDYRSAQSYHLYITARDGGVFPIRSSSAVVIIDILDINNHAPAFSSFNYEIDVPEPTQTPVDILAINAKDDDTEEGGVIRYSISSGDTTVFNIHSSLGVTTLLGPLDYETQTKYVLEITARDKGIPSLSSTATLTVNVIDFNDNIPIFPFQRIDIPVEGDATPFTSVYTVAATDIDDRVIDSTINYAILEGNTYGLFTIDTDTGEIKTVRHIEPIDISYDLVVIARDQGIPALTGTATVGVRILPGTSSNSTDYLFTVEESMPRGALVGLIGKDPNLDVTGYKISSGNYNDNFVMTTTQRGDGVIYTTRPLDREEYPLYQLGVALRHSTGEESLIVTIKVGDINDNDPVVTETSISIDLVENTPRGTILAEIVATDADENDNGEIEFAISALTPLGQKHFSVDSGSGTLRVNNEIDFEVFTSLVFIVDVKDKGRRPRSTSVTVSVNILDVDEEEIPATTGEAPSTFVSLEIPHTLKKGDKVFVADTSDFNITMENSDNVQFISVGANVFALDSGSGQISIELESLLYPTSSYLQWIVCRATNATASETKLAMIRIDTFDANENMVALVVSLDVNDLETQRDNLIARLQTYFSPQNVVRIWSIESTGSISSKRRKLLAASESVALVVVIVDDTTDDVGNVDSDKTFLTQSQLLAALQADTSGTPVAGLSDAAIPVTHVVIYVNDAANESDAHPAHVTFYLIIALAVIIALLLIAALTAYFVIQYRKSKGSLNIKDNNSDEEHLCPSPNEDTDDKLQDQQEKAFMLMSNPLPNTRQLPPLETSIGNHPFHSYRPPSRPVKTPKGLLRPPLIPPLDTAKITTKKEEDEVVVQKTSRRTKTSSKKSKANATTTTKKTTPKKIKKKMSDITRPSLTLIDDDYRIIDEDVDDYVDNTDGRKKMMRSLEDEQIAKAKLLLLKQEAEKKRHVASMKARRKMSDAPRTVQPSGGGGGFWPKKIKNAWRSPKSSSVDNPDLTQLEGNKGEKGKSPYEEMFHRPYRDKLLHKQGHGGKGTDGKAGGDKEVDRRKSFAGFNFPPPEDQEV